MSVTEHKRQCAKLHWVDIRHLWMYYGNNLLQGHRGLQRINEQTECQGTPNFVSTGAVPAMWMQGCPQTRLTGYMRQCGFSF